MKREIKFRVWDSDFKKMMLVNDVRFIDGKLIGAKGISWDSQIIIMQFTGLLDKNGKEIYEGDVLLVFDEDTIPVTDDGQGPIEECNHIVAVEMKNGVWGFEIPKSDDGWTGWYGLHYWKEDMSSDGYEVIGNIYSNPELLK